VLAARDLERSYDRVAAVRGVSLDLVPGQIVGLVGNNGAGKTTTIKMLVGLLDPTRGEVRVEGRPTREPETRRRIGYLPEESPLYDDMKPVDYLQFFAGLYDVPRALGRQRAEELLTRLGLAKDSWSRTIGTMSKGMRRKVAIARCLLHDPPVIVLDEPTSGLDPETAHELDVFLGELRRQNKAILLSAHNLSQVEELCDRILVMHGGRIVAQGTLQDLRAGFGHVRYRIAATVEFAGSHKEGAVHQAVVERLSDVEAAVLTVKQSNGIVLEVESLFPSLEEIMRKAVAEPHA
jgi:ABC-2 type transport system ATP-binding protein